MINLGVEHFLMLMAVSLLVLGVISLAAGVLILTFRVGGKDIHTLASQTARMAQKGLADDIAGLVGNASALLEALNQLVRTTSGVGVFLILVGFMLFASAYSLVTMVP